MSKVNLTKKQKADIFRSLENFSTLEAGKKFNLDKHYENKEGLRTLIYNIKKEVQKNPDEYGVSVNEVNKVVEKSDSRKLTKSSGWEGSPNDPEYLENVNLTKLTGNITKKAMWHLNRKLSSKNLQGTSMTQLAKIMGISMDKLLLLSGRSTQNVAFKAKIDINASSDKLLEQLLKHREQYVTEGKN